MIAKSGLYFGSWLILLSWNVSLAWSGEGGKLPAAVLRLPDSFQRAWNEAEDADRLKEFQRAWVEAEDAVRLNEKLQDPLPEPYFVRADIWRLAGNYDAALRDYLKAIELAARAGGDLSAYSADLAKLHEALDNLDRVPKPAAAGEGRRHYAMGVHALWNGELEDAIWSFDNAIQIEPGHPLYWYFRAVAYRKTGNERRAQHDALIGASLEWRDGLPDKLGWAFVRLQGETRVWLERYRVGDPSQRILAPKPQVTKSR